MLSCLFVNRILSNTIHIHSTFKKIFSFSLMLFIHLFYFNFYLFIYVFFFFFIIKTKTILQFLHIKQVHCNSLLDIEMNEDNIYVFIIHIHTCIHTYVRVIELELTNFCSILPHLIPRIEMKEIKLNITRIEI